MRFIKHTTWLAFLFLMFCFGNWDIDPELWNTTSRVIFCIFAMIVVLCVEMSILNDTLGKDSLSRNDWKDKAPVIEAFIEGQRVEALIDGKWKNVGGSCDFSLPTYKYRVAASS